MDTKFYNLEMSVLLEPVYHCECPEIKISLDNTIIFEGFLQQEKFFYINRDLDIGNHCLEILFSNKKDSDVILEKNLDKAIIIKNIEFENFSSPKFVWSGLYYPKYPEPWYSQQLEKNQEPAAVLTNHTYLGWNGKWVLNFTVPIFTWIHTLENFGWIYD
jgi:hypothetical protein